MTSLYTEHVSLSHHFCMPAATMFRQFLLSIRALTQSVSVRHRDSAAACGFEISRAMPAPASAPGVAADFAKASSTMLVPECFLTQPKTRSSIMFGTLSGLTALRPQLSHHSYHTGRSVEIWCCHFQSIAVGISI
jgi:hypothetical protein